jgi:transposase InsO family protein
LQQEAVSVSDACRVLQVSRSGYYAHRRAKPSAKSLQERTHIKAAFAASGASYGSRRVMHALREQGLRIGRYRVRTLMREGGLRTSWKRKFISTTDSRHTLPVAENVLDRQFDVDEPNRAWVSDITYVRTAQGWLYLAVVLDLYSRKVVGWSMAPTMPAGLVMSALTMALQQRRPAPGLMLHSDRGSQGGFNRSLQHLLKEVSNGTTTGLGFGTDGKTNNAIAWQAWCQSARDKASVLELYPARHGDRGCCA